MEAPERVLIRSVAQISPDIERLLDTELIVDSIMPLLVVLRQ